MSLKYAKILGVKVTSAERNEVIAIIESSVRNKRKITVVTPNPEIVLSAQDDEKLKEALKSSDISLPDGIGLIYASKFLKVKNTLHRISGRELMVELIKLANKHHWKVYLLGSSKDVNEKAKLKMSGEYPDTIIKGASGPIFTNNLEYKTAKDKKLDESIVSEINSFRPHLLFVGFGAPKQEKWLLSNIEKLKVNCAMVVGGSFDYYVGKTLLPPNYISKMGLEWLWRLCTKPGHTWRVFRALILFPVAIALSRIKNSH